MTSTKMSHSNPKSLKLREFLPLHEPAKTSSLCYITIRMTGIETKALLEVLINQLEKTIRKNQEK